MELTTGRRESGRWSCFPSLPFGSILSLLVPEERTDPMSLQAQAMRDPEHQRLGIASTVFKSTTAITAQCLLP
jgi:hypothetical protein